MGADDVILKTESLAKAFGGVQAVDGASLTVREGELRCLIGPNGAGKSTLFQLLAGLLRPDDGRILFRGRDITFSWAYERVQRGIGLKFQTNRAYHQLTVRENLFISRPPKARRPDRNPRAERRYQLALEMSGLLDHLHVPARELPHSQLQWLEMCMALAPGPDLLLLDEPTTGMTPEETSRTAQLVKTLNAEGLTLIVVEHDMSFVREVAETVTVLHQGRVFLEGTLDQVSADENVKRIYLGDS